MSTRKPVMSHRAVGLITGKGSVRSMRRDVARPAAIAAAIAVCASLVVIVDDIVLRAVAVAVATFLLSFVALFVVDRVVRVSDEVDALSRDAISLWRLAPLGVPSGAVLPPLGGYALSPPAATALVAWVLRRQPRTIVELGPGSSTVLLARAGRTFPVPPTITCLEQEPEFAEHVRRTLQYDKAVGVRIVDAPLESVTVGAWRGQWYGVAALEELPTTIDLLVVDGPPERVGPDARFPAYPLLRPRLGPGSIVFVDDTSRFAERSMVERWVADGAIRVIEEGRSFTVLEQVVQPAG
jgi:phospholipid N-methyltransferase